MSKWHRANQDNYFSDSYIKGENPFERPVVDMDSEPIRRITPLEGFRLQGFPDKYAEIATQLKISYAEGIQRFKIFKQNVVDALQNPESEQ